MPIERFQKTLHLNDAQHTALDALKDATAKGADILKADCPETKMLTPPGRVGEIQQR